MNSISYLRKMIEATPNVKLPPVLQGLSAKVHEQLSDTRANDEVSSDEELVEFWSNQCGIPVEVAQAALALRRDFLLHPLFNPFQVNTPSIS
jgi:hypothetical protein